MNRDITTPVSVGSAVLGLVGAVLALLTAFGVALSEEQLTAILGFVSAVLVVAPLVLKTISVAKARVVEQVDAVGVVTAGPANDLVGTGQTVRHLGAEGE